MKIGKVLFSAALSFFSACSFAATYSLPASNESIIGQVQYSSAGSGDNVVTVAKRYDIGFNSLESANPYLNMGRGFTSGTPLLIPTQHLLPNQPRKGIVINLPEMRMYYYPEGSNQVLTYPIGIGKIGKTIPITKAKITRKATNPTWIPPQDIREFNLEQGIVLPRIMPPGPDNPLGPYAIYMSIPTYLIHSTIFPESVGRRASFGCIRMYESDIEQFFPSVKGGIPVVITNSPVKAGWQNDHLYLEAHQPLEEHNANFDASLPGMVHMVANMTKDQPTLVDWQLISYIAKERDGLPHEVGVRIQ
ncbi:L,D-transpeptidase family protein [Aquicella lusitana]|uniref:L,D-transpeptidase ErfK/SrfK n=1 Tax=Aquicella lusitana TaxID=254246 RepID=A0A370GTL9_9COXI|nr:L,D-transpeptidase family protein [Aquicella lusitana]RDI46596.1 L,D-transpeptidase ErfK/SrfK [Aquicella lusitana]VVC74260.1 putative L,D-transpeptidase YnhG [Aquicella lusitana]